MDKGVWVKETPVMPWRERLICKCGTEMEFQSYVMPTYPAMCPHRCPTCGHEERPNYAYPRITYRPLAEPLEKQT